MATEGPGRAGVPSLTSLPKFEDIPQTGDGLDAERVREAFEAFRRHAAQLQAQLRVIQAAGRGASVEATGHAVRMDALHLIRAASEFADVLERDAQAASAAQLGRTEEEVRRRQKELQALDATIDAKRSTTEREIAEMLAAAKNDASEMRKNGERDASASLLEAEARGTRLVEQARHKSTEMANGARAEVEQTLDWARSQASAIIFRAQDGAEKLLTAAGLGPDALGEVASAIMDAARSSSQATLPPLMGTASPPSSPPAPAAPEPTTKAQGESE
jgi:cell division septum initiation protein DivIVA